MLSLSRFWQSQIPVDPGDDVHERKHKTRNVRSFAPIQRTCKEYFEGRTGDYAVVSRCRHADRFPAIVHYDNTSRVQTVPRDSESGLRKLLERWYADTGCPMLLNTSLNIKGEPLVNTRSDAQRWSEKYGVKVCLPK